MYCGNKREVVAATRAEPEESTNALIPFKSGLVNEPVATDTLVNAPAATEAESSAA